MRNAAPIDPLIAALRRAASMPWYRRLLDEHGVDPERVADAAAFASCPVLTKQNTFERFPIHELAAGTAVRDLAGVLTSSGHGSRFSFGLISRDQAREGGRAIDLALEAAFAIDRRATLAINCLPMGVTFGSERMTVATVSVREDMAVALVETFGAHFDQILLVADPLFMKRLLDYAAGRGVRWESYRMQAVIGEEVFGERFRSYVAAALGLDADRPERGYVMSSFGVGELGLHLCFETPATIALRRAAAADPDLARELLGVASPREGVPAVLAYHPGRTFVEILDADAAGYGALTISMLDPQLPIPLLRYQTGDTVRAIDPSGAADILRRRGIALPGPLPEALLALRGRAREMLPDGSHVAVYKDALYADPAVAAQLTGAFRIGWVHGASVLDVQLVPGRPLDSPLEKRLMDALPDGARPTRIQCWEYERFPHGMSLDYERKFTYYAP